MRFRAHLSSLAASLILVLCISASRAQTTASPDAEPVLASYRGGEITVAELEQVIAIKPQHVRVALAQSTDKQKALLESMIDFEVLLQEAQRRGYADHPAVKLAMQDAAVGTLIEQLAVAPQSVPDAEVDAAYAERAGDFKRPEQRRARQVVLATKADATALIAEARAPGVDPSELIARAARERSLDEATKGRGGELGFFIASGQRIGTDGKVPPEIAKAAFALRGKDKLWPKPIATQGGFSVLVLTDTVPAADVNTEKARATVRNDLAKERSKQAVDALLAELRTANPVELHAERVERVTLEPAADPDIPHGFPAAPRDPSAPSVTVESDGF